MFLALTVLTGIGLVLTTLYGLYHLAISARFIGRLPKLPEPRDHRRFAILVFARNEEQVIGQLLDSLNRQNYPADSFQIFLTADNCTDATAQVGRAHGATVRERSSDTKGKGAALNWFFAEHDLSGFDACVIFDADNVVDPGFLDAMNRQLNVGNKVAVGYRMGKNPSSSWVAGSSTIFWLMQTRFFHLPRAMRKLPLTSVGGTGFMFSLDVLGPRGWDTFSACEDIEFTLQAIADGHHVAFAPDALFYDEQPLTLWQSIKQRYRWSVGSMQLIRTAVPKLVAAARRGQLNAIDASLYIIGVVVGGLSALLWITTLILGLFAGIGPMETAGGILASSVIGYLLMAAFGVLVLRLEKASWPGVWKAVAGFPIWLFSWSVINVLVLFYRDPTWYTVPHTEAMSLEESARVSA